MALRTEVVPVELNDFEEQDIHYATLDVLIFMIDPFEESHYETKQSSTSYTLIEITGSTT